ncbi:MAG: 4-(cytidine 5'-diphospho)-2-C-methyl-D-erythritol kinase [Alphaproteobacteria bacterium]|nr:4-(cytidine 5'-diphospho)-2-C-methyl-D-erythritol kinase [Alphaproteobacteria bacterium]
MSEQSSSLAAFAPAKINLFLEVTGRRADGYHLLDSLVVFAGIGDSVAVAPAERLELHLDGPFGAGLAAEPDNLVLRAARALAENHGIAAQASIRLTKRLPIASGIGGGSSDAAAALRALSALWNLSPDPASLQELALGLGADVPACLLARPLRMEGIGDRLTPLAPLPPLSVLLVNPLRPVPTGQVFRHPALVFSGARPFEPDLDGPARFAGFLRGRRNDLEAPAIAIEPEIGRVLSLLENLPGSLLARMSGSGATCFALFAEAAAADLAARRMREIEPSWWVAAGPVLP